LKFGIALFLNLTGPNVLCALAAKYRTDLPPCQLK
jgi:hypothetical protein